MFVELLSENKKREIFKKLLMMVEADQRLVEKCASINKIHATGKSFFMNFANDFEMKTVEIDDVKATISSESNADNDYITMAYQEEMGEIFQTKYYQFLKSQGCEISNMEELCGVSNI